MPSMATPKSSPSDFTAHSSPLDTSGTNDPPSDDDADDFGSDLNKDSDDAKDQSDDDSESGNSPGNLSARKIAEPFRIKHPWPAGYWGGPNVFLRTALFSSTKSGPGEHEPGYLASLQHTHLKATGPRLNQWDLDVFMCVLNACRDGMTLDMTARQFLRSMRRGESSRDVEILMASCKRLHECYIDASFRYRTMKDKRRWAGNLLDTFECIDVKTTSTGKLQERIRISLDHRLWWFIRDDYTWFDIEERKLLRQHRLAAGLFAMYHTHACELSYPLDRLRDLLGVVARGKEFERLLRAALGFLHEHKLVEAWQISDGQLSVAPKMTVAKIAYLVRNGLPVPAVATQAGTPPKPQATKDSTASFSTTVNRFSTEFIQSVGTWIVRIAGQISHFTARTSG